MFGFLKNHPFAVEAFFESSIVLTFAVPKAELQALIPKHLELDTLNDEWAFLAMAMVQTKNLRPKGFPKFLGNDFFLIGYRIFVKYIDKKGKRLRGLYIIRSETNKKQMELFGNIFTHYNYTTTDIVIYKQDNSTIISSENSDFRVDFDLSHEPNIPPMGSPFNDLKEARRFAGPLPFTFTVNDKKDEILIIEGVRENWVPKPIQINDFQISFIDSLHLKDVKLANVFMITNIPYYWKKGKIESWNR
jgi:hypothetical protein